MSKSLFRRVSKKLIISINIVVALLFLLGCYAGHFKPNPWWPIGLLTLSNFYIFIILIGFFFFWLFVRARYSLIFLITMALVWSPLQKIIPFRTVPVFSLQKKSGALRVMSWNVAQFDVLGYKKNPAVKNQMISLINEYDPDIACFQEMVAGDTATDLNTSYYKRYPFFALLDFEKSFRFTNDFYCYNTKEDYLYKQHFGLIIFSKYPIINKQTRMFYPYDYNSIFQFADIRKGSDTIRVFNIHLQSLKFHGANLHYIENPSFENKEDLKRTRYVIGKLKWGFLNRQVQAERIRDEISRSPYPVILCGDFNDVPNSYAYETIGDGLNNTFEKKGSGIGRTFSGVSPTLRIDNIFCSPTINVLQFNRIPKILSDHFPVMADLDGF